MGSAVEVYFDEHGKVSGVWVLLDVNGQKMQVEFQGNYVAMFALYPDDADTVNDDFTPIDCVVLPEKPRE